MDEKSIRARLDGVSWADLPIVAVDLETTGLVPWADRITEIGAVGGRDPANRPGEWEYESLVNPDRPIPASIQRLTGIDETVLEGARDWFTVLEELDSIVGYPGSRVLCAAHNAAFESSFLSQHSHSRWRADWWLDTQILAKVINGASRKEPGYTLGFCANRYRVDFLGSAHRALPDARVTWQLLGRLVTAGGWATPADALIAQRVWLDAQ